MRLSDKAQADYLSVEADTQHNSLGIHIRGRLTLNLPNLFHLLIHIDGT